MAILTNLLTGRSVALTAHTVVGRNPSCAVHLHAARVSTEHASVRWRRGSWWLRDLGSRNGTWHNGESLDGAVERPVGAGDRVSFGGPDDVWVMEDGGPPELVVACLDRPDCTVRPSGGVLALPDADTPEVVLILQPDGVWHRDANGQKVQDGDVLVAGSMRWRVHLPQIMAMTTGGKPETVRAVFRVSRDEEFVQLHIQVGGKTSELQARSHHYLLLTLARLRLHEAHLTESSQGWIDQFDLSRSLDLQYRTINVQLHRARQEVGQLREDLASRIVERRAGTKQLRWGLADVQIELI